MDRSHQARNLLTLFTCQSTASASGQQPHQASGAQSVEVKQGLTLYKDCATLRIRMLLNKARPQPLSSDRTSVLAGPPLFMILSGIHRGSCTMSTSALWLRLWAAPS